MASVDYDACEARVLAHEGGYTNDPQDPGGPTNWGITIADARAYWRPNATAADVRSMPLSVAKGIYRSKYWNAMRCDDLPAGVDDSVFDYGVNSGIGRSGKVLRRVVGQPDTDWHVTDDVLASVKARDPKAIIIAMNDERLRFLQGLRTWPTFGRGWGTRVAEVKAFSLQLALGSTTAPPVKPAPGKGSHPAPSTKPVIVGGGSAAAGAGGLIHWLGGHPIVIAVMAAVVIAAIVYVLGRIQKAHQAAQEAPTPGLVPVPVQVPTPASNS